MIIAFMKAFMLPYEKGLKKKLHFAYWDLYYLKSLSEHFLDTKIKVIGRHNVGKKNT